MSNLQQKHRFLLPAYFWILLADGSPDCMSTVNTPTASYLQAKNGAVLLR